MSRLLYDTLYMRQNVRLIGSQSLLLGARESWGHLEKCIALSDVYNYKKTHCFVLVNKN